MTETLTKQVAEMPQTLQPPQMIARVTPKLGCWSKVWPPLCRGANSGMFDLRVTIGGTIVVSKNKDNT